MLHACATRGSAPREWPGTAEGTLPLAGRGLQRTPHPPQEGVESHACPTIVAGGEIGCKCPGQRLKLQLTHGPAG